MNVLVEVKGKAKSGRTNLIKALTKFLESKGAEVNEVGVHSISVVATDGFLAPVPEEGNCCKETEDKPESALAVAHRIVHNDREQTYGDPGKNFRTIAAYWITHIKAAYSIDVPLTEADVCGMMVLLKQARLANNPSHRDSIVDIAGYAELNDVIQQRKVKQPKLTPVR